MKAQEVPIVWQEALDNQKRKEWVTFITYEKNRVIRSGEVGGGMEFKVRKELPYIGIIIIFDFLNLINNLFNLKI